MNPSPITGLVERGWHRECHFCEGEGCANCDHKGYSWTTQPCTLADAPVGLLWAGGTLAMKTEYGNNEGRIDAYIVASGEMLWGPPPQTIASQRAQLAMPIDYDAAAAALSLPTPIIDREAIARAAAQVRHTHVRQYGKRCRVMAVDLMVADAVLALLRPIDDISETGEAG